MLPPISWVGAECSASRECERLRAVYKGPWSVLLLASGMEIDELGGSHFE